MSRGAGWKAEVIRLQAGGQKPHSLHVPISGDSEPALNRRKPSELTGPDVGARALEMVDSAGNPVALTSATSATSSFDYRMPYVSAVPEVPGGEAMLAGLALLWAARRVQSARRS